MATSAVLTIAIDNHSKESKYQQLQRQIETLVVQRRLLPNEKLPSSRELVAALGISRTSVLRALDNLIAEGVLTSQAKKGVFVAHLQPLLRTATSLHSGNEQNQQGASASSVYTQSANLEAFDSGADTSAFASRDWANSLKRAWLNPEQAMMQGAYADGFPQLKQNICDYLQQLRGLYCEPEQIVVTAGNRDSLSILSYALTAKTDAAIWLEQACYPQIPALVQSLQKEQMVLPIDDEGACVPYEKQNRQEQLAILTPCRQYPLGLTMSSTRRQQWLDFILQQKQQGRPFWLIEDDYDNEFVYQGRANVPLMQQDQSESIFFVGSFSKVMFRGLRLGFIVAPKSLAAAVKKSQSALGVSGASVAQPALADFMANGKFVTHLRRMRRHYLTKRNILLEAVTPLSEYFDWQKVSGGMHVCLFLKPQWSNMESDIKIAAQKHGLLLNPISRHFIAEPKATGFILGFSQPSEAQLSHFVGLFIKSVREVVNNRRHSGS